jgi:predicted metal-dependent phosphoesterase TrpH
VAVLADLHTHSTYSDGTTVPREVVRRAKGRGVEVLVLSDHDSVSGVAEAAEAAKELGMRFGAGIEINTCEDDMVHILGYGIDIGSPRFKDRLEEFRSRRVSRIGLIVERLQALGVDLTLEEVQGGSLESLGRPHVADALRRKKIVKNRGEAFQRYLKKGAEAYVAPMGPTALEAIETIESAGGFASLAHPLTVAKDAPMGDWVDAGLKALEVHYVSHTGPQREKLAELAQRYSLEMTGGSDYHGPGTGREDIGGVAFPDEVFARFEGRLKLS